MTTQSDRGKKYQKPGSYQFYPPANLCKRLKVVKKTGIEKRAAPPNVAGKYAELLGLEPERIKLSNDAVALASVYIRENIVSQKYQDDALHIAHATIAKVDILVSWNFKHIVNYGKIRQFNSVNLRQGYNTIQIYSPREVTNYGD